jgi:hypothetical protein
VNISQSIVDIRNSLVNISHSIVDIRNSLVKISNSLVNISYSLLDIRNSLVNIIHSLVNIRNSLVNISLYLLFLLYGMIIPMVLGVIKRSMMEKKRMDVLKCWIFPEKPRNIHRIIEYC